VKRIKEGEGRTYKINTMEGMETPSVLLIVPTAAGNLNYLVHEWGFIIIDGIPRHFFDLNSENRVELYNDQPFIMHHPNKGYTYEADGSCRALRPIEKKVVLM